MKRILVKIGLLAALLSATSLTYAAFMEDSVFIKEKSHNIYHVIKGKTLLQATDQIAKRSGIGFKINVLNEKDLINATLAADDWKSTLSQLLKDYNFTIETDKTLIKKVIVTGLKGSGKSPSISETEISPFITVSPLAQSSLPSRYQHYNAGSVQPIKLPMTSLMHTPVGHQVTLDIPIGQYVINHDSLEPHVNGGATWAGYLDNEGIGYRVYLSQGEAGIMGNINTPDGGYEIETVDGQTYLVDLTRSGLKPVSYHNDQELNPILGNKSLLNAKTANATVAFRKAKALKTKAAPALLNRVPVVDIMILYTQVNQTPSYVKQRLNYLIAVSNIAYKDSKINLKLRLVHTRPTNYPESNSNSIALDALSTSPSIAKLRETYGADLVFFFRPFYANTSDSCGTTFVEFAYGLPADPTIGFGTISDGNSRDSNHRYYCGMQTFTHEIGHSLGTVHDREISSFPGKFSYSYAWGINGTFGTIMSYDGPSLMLFSTPLLPTQCIGNPCGYDAGKPNASDQSRTINYTAPTIANLKPRKIDTPVLW